MKKFIALSFALIGWSLGGIAAALEFSRTFEAVRGEAGDARLYFTCSAKKVTSFEVDVNGVWAGSVAVPPARGTPELQRALSDLIFMPEMWKDSSLYRKKVDAVYQAMEAAERHIPLS